MMLIAICNIGYKNYTAEWMSYGFRTIPTEDEEQVEDDFAISILDIELLEMDLDWWGEIYLPIQNNTMLNFSSCGE